MGAIRVHEFMTLDGVISEPTFAFEYGFDPKMGEALAGAMADCQGSCLVAPRTRCSSQRGRPGPLRKTPGRRS